MKLKRWLLLGAQLVTKVGRLLLCRNSYPFADRDGVYDLTRFSGAGTVITAGDTYKFVNVTEVKAALGWTNGNDHWAYTSAGAPKAVTGATLTRNGQGPAFFVGDAFIALYSTNQSLAKAKSIYRSADVHTILDANTTLNSSTILR
jgi:hypothetical protein